MFRAGSLALFVWAVAMAGPQAAAQDAALQRALQDALNAAVASDETPFPGATLYVSHPERGTYIAAAGVTDIQSNAPLSPDAHFRAGSTMKPFVATVVLQLIEEGKLSLDAMLTSLLPPDITGRFPGAGTITLRQLLDHTSGIPEWLSPPVVMAIAGDPTKVWDPREFLDIAAAQPANFPPGQGWSYSNTNYNLLGLVIDRTTGRSWREEIRERILGPLGLDNTLLPEPGDLTIPGAFMHGYALLDGNVVDLSFIDPSMAGAAGGGALVTTVGDLAAFLAALRAGELFSDPGTFATMSDFVDAAAEGGHTGYGLGLERYDFGGLEMIGHLGGTAGYRSGTFYFPSLDLGVAFAMSVQSDPTPVIAAALEVMAR